MNSLQFTENIIYNVSDIISGIFLTILIGSLSLQSVRRQGLSHLLAATILILGGLFVRVFASMAEQVPADYKWRPGLSIISHLPASVVWIVAFIFIIIGITESATYVIYINENGDKKGLRQRYVCNAVLIAAGAAMFIRTGNINSFAVITLAQLAYLYVHMCSNWPGDAPREFGRASIAALATFAVELFIHPARFSGAGLSVMLIIMAEQYHYHIGQELEKSEAALARSRVQLLAEQISPHYIYNSLQSISGLCGEENEKAKTAIDAFAGYLRGNLESFTDEDLIPFTKELAHTRAYLELEEIAGNRRFSTDYILETTDFMLPPLVLQPVVENAVKHGTAAGSGKNTAENESAAVITIATYERDGDVYIEVTDIAESRDSDAVSNHEIVANVEMPESAKKRIKTKSVGLENVRTRLAIQCDGTLDISSLDKGTKVTIKLPKSATQMP